MPLRAPHRSAAGLHNSSVMASAREGGDGAVGTVGHGRCCGSFGELLQGALPGEDLDFLVTLPIRRWSHATFRASPEYGELCVMPPEKTKAREAAQRTLAMCGLPPGGRLTVTSQLPEGKGLASSTADREGAV